MMLYVVIYHSMDISRKNNGCVAIGKPERHVLKTLHCGSKQQ